MQETHDGILLSRREALAASAMAEERGATALGEAVTKVMVDYYKDLRKTGDDLLPPGIFKGEVALRGRLRAGAQLPEGFFHIPFAAIDGLDMISIRETCEPTDNLEREIDLFVG